MLCRPAGYSWLDASGVATEDRRMVNPGLEGRWGGRPSGEEGEGERGREGKDL